MYFNYANFPTNKITIHEAVCRFCNNGQGVQNEILNGTNGSWHGPFSTYQFALANANDILLLEFQNGAEICDCGHCNPH